MVLLMHMIRVAGPLCLMSMIDAYDLLCIWGYG